MRIIISLLFAQLATSTVFDLDGQILQAIAAGTAATSRSNSCTPATGYSHCRILTINEALTGGATLSGFPVLVAIALGPSRIQSPNCYDVVFTSDPGGSIPIPWQQSACTASTGAVLDWVFLESIPASTNTSFYVSYDNPAISSPQNVGAKAPANVWNSGFRGVWHLDETDVASGAILADSTSNADNCTVGASLFVSTAGEIENAINPRMTGGISNLHSTIALPLGMAWGASWWIQAASSINDSAIGGNSSDYSYIRAADGSGNVAVRGADGSMAQVSLGTFAAGTWYSFAVEVSPGGGVTFYKNGIAIGSGAIGGNVNISGLFGNNYGTYSYLPLDELHFYTGNHGSGWIAAEYNNQQTPGAFVTAGAEF